MAKNILEKFDELFSDVDAIDPAKIEIFVHESLKFFDELKTKLTSLDDKEREEAMKIAEQLQQRLELFAQKAIDKTGMTKEQLEEYVSQQSNFTPESWDSFQSAESEIKEYKKHITPPEKV
jgi:hypothetical protein